MLHPFFSYFGSKFKLAPLYENPAFDTIIEPFAGSAGYSLLYPQKKIILYDNYLPVIELWKYLIHVKETEILSLPVQYFDKENPISQCNIAEEAKTLIGFWTTESQTSPSNYVLSKSRGSNWTEIKRAKIAAQLQFIRHWQAFDKSYEKIDNCVATWHIDPPYSRAGKRYKKNSINYTELSQWCLERTGQVMVCEQGDADWLPFQLLRTARNASNNAYKEVVWYNHR